MKTDRGKCRVCLDELDDEQGMFSLFTDTKEDPVEGCGEDSGDEVALKLFEKVEYCCGVRIRPLPDMPSKICLKCFDMTRIWFNFRQLCINTQLYLESLCFEKDAEYLGSNEEEYLEDLLEDLQTFRAEKRRRKPSVFRGLFDDARQLKGSDEEHMDVAGRDHGEKIESDLTDDECIETVPLAELDSDSELEHLVESIENNVFTDKPSDRVGDIKSSRALSSLVKRRERSPAKKYERNDPPTCYMCSVCGNVYKKRASFQYHMRLHTDVRPHECEICKKSFRQMCELKSHIRRHTGEKPYKCTYCDRHFIDRSERHRHERVHTNTRPYSCSICGKSFMYSAILKNHMKLHSGERNFNCLICRKSFTLQHQLKAHLQTITHKQKEIQFLAAGYEVVVYK